MVKHIIEPIHKSFNKIVESVARHTAHVKSSKSAKRLPKPKKESRSK